MADEERAGSRISIPLQVRVKMATSKALESGKAEDIRAALKLHGVTLPGNASKETLLGALDEARSASRGISAAEATTPAVSTSTGAAKKGGD